ncbi:HET-domain-containing protein [Colletotrichum eremochloae]|nr:HET-domain-containing protein [Colletotrichum eremochloae]
MRFLTVSENNELALVERVGTEIEPYAILSHTWGRDSDEISYKDFVENRYKSKKGFLKLDFCRKRAAFDGLEYFWVDTCCIDKSSSAELTEAINSMYRWYQGAARCYVFLADVTVTTGRWINAPASRQALRNSRWFKRGWTLQELIAPKLVNFFDSNGVPLGDKHSLFRDIHEVTKLPLDLIRGQTLDKFSVDMRMSWAEGRETKREEDAAYCLLGIFDIYMPLIYGEGRDRAFRRLLKELRELRSNETPEHASQSSQQGQVFAATGPQAVILDPQGANFFERYDPIDPNSQRNPIALMPMWPGNYIRTKHSELYLQRRDQTASFAHGGVWDRVLELLDIAAEEHGENWSNAVRLRAPHEANKLSFWTILHQAAFMRAPKNIIKHLIDRGSLRTIRTRVTDDHFTHHDFTAADIARESKQTQLASILAPVIYHPIPYQTLARLQSLFYEIIRADLGVQMAHLILPDLVALTELKVPQMWFPVGEQGDPKCAVGYIYKLEDRTLIVTKLGIEGKSPKVYKIE